MSINALLIAGKHNPELLDKYCDLEEKIGHTFQNGRAISEIRKAIANGEEAVADSTPWKM